MSIIGGGQTAPVTYPNSPQPPQDPWQGQHGQPYVPPPSGTVPMPVLTPPPRPRRKVPVWAGVGIGFGAVVMSLCACGVVGAIVGPPDEPSDKQERAVVSSATAAAPSDPATTGAPPPTATAAPTTSATMTASPARVYYASCAAVRASGKAPLRKGQPGFRAALDRDGDGVACEAGETSPKPTPKKTTAAPKTDPRFDTCAKAKAAGYGPYVRGVDPEYAWYQDRDGDGRVCE
jgi:hypothetical protein